MILFFKKDDTVYAVQATTEFSAEEISRLQWLFGGAEHLGPKASKVFSSARAAK